MNPHFHTDFSISDSLIFVRKSVLIYETIIGKAKILNCVYSWYMKERGSILLENKDSGKEDIDIIRQNSDKIIDMVQDKIFETVKAANEIDIMYIEDMELGVTCFTCYCFMECKILEKPL